MVSIISMQDMRHLNLFSRITRIQTRHCLTYNDTLIFCVPKPMISRAIGKNNENLRKISEVVKRRVRVAPLPRDVNDASAFIQSIISPAKFKSIEITEDKIIVTAGTVQNKATLLGRNKRRYEEMKKVIQSFFHREYFVA